MTAPAAATTGRRWPILLALVLVTLNLRTALASIPAVEVDIVDATGWSATVAGALTMLPVLAMGAFALVVPRLAARIGRRRTVALALLIITIAFLMRLAALVPGVLHLSALLAGVGIALAAGLVPAVVREQLPRSIGVATSLWTAGMMTGAALAGALTVPLAARLGSWQMALAAWAIPAALAAVVWWLVEERGHPEHPRADEPARPPVRLRDLPWRNPHARVLSAYLLFNSIIFYTTLAWLDPSYVAHGATRQEAGLMFAAYSTTPILGALLMPALAQRLRARRSLFALMVLLTTVPLAALAFAPTVLPGLNAAVFGFGAGAGFAMGLALLSEWPVDAAASARMTAMAYSTMYLIAAFGPLAGGALLDVTSSWAVLFAALVVVSLLQLATVVGLRRGVQVR